MNEDDIYITANSSHECLELSASNLDVLEDSGNFHDPCGQGCCWKNTVSNGNKINSSVLSAGSMRSHISSCSEQGEDKNDTLAQDLNALTIKEREEVVEEIHGVSDIVEETSELVAERLKEMKLHLERIPKKQRKALDKAFFLKPSLAFDEKLCLMFLRATRFDPDLSARKMCRHFDHKVELFGIEKIVKKITFDDLAGADQDILHSGKSIFMKEKDQSGRAVRLTAFSLLDTSDWKSTVRAMWYQSECVLEDEDVQKKGVVEVLHFYSTPRFPASRWVQFVMNSGHIWEDWPYRTCGGHICFQNPTVTYSFVKPFFSLMNNPNLRIRLRTHCGSPLEAQYALLTFGIDLAGCLEEGKGFMKASFIQAECEKRRHKESRRQTEEETSTAGLIPYAISKDVLTGRGQAFWEHPGNIYLSSMTKMFAARYVAAESRLEKSVITIEISQRIQASGGRFIQRSSTGWTEVANDVARRKISQSMRQEARQLKNGYDCTATSMDSTHPGLPLEVRQRKGEYAFHPTPELARVFASSDDKVSLQGYSDRSPRSDAAKKARLN